MGTSSDAHCFHCGYDTFLILGAGLSNFETHASWPVSCPNCAPITTANYKKPPLACDKCGSTEVMPVSDRLIWKGDGKRNEQWGELTLTDGHYRCPICGLYELRFGTGVGGHPIVTWD